MKKFGRISGLLLLILLSDNISLEAQRGMRRMMMDSTRMNRMGRGFRNDWMMDRFDRGMGPRTEEGDGFLDHGTGVRLFRDIPDLTDKQKKNIEELMQKQQEEMKKFRDEMMTKMKSLRESHRVKVMDLLTPEQKKWFEENTGNPPEK